MKITFENFPEAENLFREIGKAFSDCGEKIYVVGGAVRDYILCGNAQDYDFTTTASSWSISHIARSFARTVYDKTHARGHSTMGVILKNGVELEITPFRAINPGSAAGDRLVTGTSLTDDLSRRDFTVNAMAVNIAPDNFGALEDPFDGLKDLQAKKLRTPIPPMSTFEDDPLRTLRAVRFSIKFDLVPAPELVDTVRHLFSETEILKGVSMERVRVEILKILMLQTPSRGVRMMLDWGLLDFWLPEVSALNRMSPEPEASHKDMFEHTLKVLDRASEMGIAEPCLMLSALLHDVGKPASRRLEGGEYSFREHEKIGAEMAESVCARLKMSCLETEIVTELVKKHHRLHGYEPEWTDSAVRRALHDLGGRYMRIADFAKADVTSSYLEKVSAGTARIDHFLSRVSALEREVILNPRPPVDGNEIAGLLGVAPGPVIGKVVNYLKGLIVSGELAAEDAETARKIILERRWEQ